MKTFLRISLEVMIISLTLLFLNYSFSQESGRPTTSGRQIEATLELVGVTTVEWNAKSLRNVSWDKFYSELKGSGYTAGSNYFPIMGFAKGIGLKPLTMNLKYPLGEKAISGEDLAIIFASYRDSVAASNDDLEKRVTRLENKIAQIEKECCAKK